MREGGGFMFYYKTMLHDFDFKLDFRVVQWPDRQMHITLTQKGRMKVHFYSPNPMIFQKKHLKDVEVHTFFHFQVHTTII
jgi:hypothetical protein